MINDKISIVVPVYNLENYIIKTLESICNQTYRNIEILVVDDGSKDSSWNLICDFAKNDKRIRPIHQENGGVTSARLNGIKNATGDWIGFVDGDDLIDEDMYELLINNAHKYNADISHCGYKTIVNNEKIIYFHNTGQIIEQDNKKGLLDLLEGSLVEPGIWNKLYKKSLLSVITTELIDPSIKSNEDFLMNYYLFKQSNKSVFEDVCKYNYIVRQDSFTRDNTKFNANKIFDPIRVREQIIADAEGEVKELAIIRYIDCCISAFRGAVLNKDKKTAKIVNSKINKHNAYISKLSKKQRMILLMLRILPNSFRLIDKFYIKNIQDKQYL